MVHANANVVGAGSFHENDNGWRQSLEVEQHRQEYRNTISPDELLLRSLALPPVIPDCVESFLFRNAASKAKPKPDQDLLSAKRKAVAPAVCDTEPCNFFVSGGGSSLTQQHADDLMTNPIKGEDCSVHIQNSKSMGFEGPGIFTPENPDFMMPPLVSLETSEASKHLTQPNELGVKASFLQSGGGSSYLPQLHENDMEILEAFTHSKQPTELGVKASLPQSGSSFRDQGEHYCHMIGEKTKDPSQLLVSRANDFPSDSTKATLQPAKRQKKEAGVGVSEMQLKKNNVKDVVSLPDTFPSSSTKTLLHSAKRRKKEDGFCVPLVNDENCSQRKCLKDQSFPPEIRSEMQQPKVSTCSEVKECNMVQLKKNNVKGVVSLPETFTRDQLNEHIMSLRKQLVQSTIEEEMGIAANTCRLCTKEKLFMTPTPIDCLLCYKRIKQNANYFYRNDEELHAETFVCSACFKKSKDGSITVNERSVRTELFERKKNDEVNEEPWVECDKCKSWQHQICGLYNNKRDLDNNAEYICPVCRIEEIDNGMHVPLPKTAVFGAKDLPTTTLSDHIEKRLRDRLKHVDWEKVERDENLDEVLVAESLSVREVLSVDKKLNVSKQFLDILPKEEIYPTELPYRSRVILLFQKIEGADVCIFVMYVQEFGSKCGYPSQRCVYISYLDSVKYFRPQRKFICGEALRTFVYHEILIRYLDFCKKRGFTTCYIWSCPPKGEDYILYCHPKTQKIPKNDQLRHWYLSMLEKAAQENIVVGLTNIYDYYFVTTRKSDSKVTASRLPYFDGDYWSSRAMDLAWAIEKESGGDYEKILKKLVTKRGLKAMGHTNPSKSNAKDILVMQKLGESILPSKEDFIVAHLQHSCMHCREVIMSGKRWCCTECKKFQECERCHTADFHISESEEVHTLCQVSVDIPSNTEENDFSLNNKLFEDRNTFLSFCQKNQLQFDALRRAKYSSMMILDHLKNTKLCLSPQMLKYLQVIHHASQCHSTRDKPCFYPHCLQVRKLFRHAARCTIRVSRGCRQCEKVWRGIIAHSRNCKDLECCIPRCRCIKARRGLCSACLCKICKESRERQSTNS